MANDVTIYRKNSNLPVSLSSDNLGAYLKQIKDFPLLSLEEEQKLAEEYKETGDMDAAHKLVTSHLRLVAKIAFKYRYYGLPLADIISEGNIGLMKAVKKFEPKKGFRLATYAMWWIKATINEFILSSWSMVKIGTVAAQKKLFFKLRGLKEKLGIVHSHDMNPDEVKKIANELKVKEQDVIDMNRRMGGDVSLNTKLSDEDQTSEKIDFLSAGEDFNQETAVVEDEEKSIYHKMLKEAMKGLKEREKYILTERKLKDNPKTLEDLAKEFNISRERIRQIEEKAFEKVQKFMIKKKSEMK